MYTYNKPWKADIVPETTTRRASQGSARSRQLILACKSDRCEEFCSRSQKISLRQSICYCIDNKPGVRRSQLVGKVMVKCRHLKPRFLRENRTMCSQHFTLDFYFLCAALVHRCSRRNAMVMKLDAPATAGFNRRGESDATMHRPQTAFSSGKSYNSVETLSHQFLFFVRRRPSLVIYPALIAVRQQWIIKDRGQMTRDIRGAFRFSADALESAANNEVILLSVNIPQPLAVLWSLTLPARRCGTRTLNPLCDQ